MPDPLPDDIRVALDASGVGPGRFGAPLHYFVEVGSTNDVASRLAQHGAPEGTTVVASSQTAGRGRLGRSWFSPPGAGLYVSIVVRDSRIVPWVTLAGGVAVADAIRASTGLLPEIKWPNDVVVDAGRGRRRKLAGILAEASSDTTGVEFVVLGAGINVLTAAYPPDIEDRATSLETELGRHVEAGPLLAALLQAFSAHAEDVSTRGAAALLERWRMLAPSAVGSRVEWESAEGWRAGKTAGIDRDGALLVRSGAAIERIISGTVRWL